MGKAGRCREIDRRVTHRRMPSSSALPPPLIRALGGLVQRGETRLRRYCLREKGMAALRAQDKSILRGQEAGLYPCTLQLSANEVLLKC